MQADPDIPAAAQENLKIINRSGRHLLTLVNDVLDMAKAEAGQVVVETAPFDLGGLVRDVIDIMQHRAVAKGLSVILDQSSQFPRYVDADEAKLRQVLINLLSNAVKYTVQGEIVIRLGVEAGVDDTQLKLIIEVEDSGIGISAKDQAVIFQPLPSLVNRVR